MPEIRMYVMISGIWYGTVAWQRKMGMISGTYCGRADVGQP